MSNLFIQHQTKIDFKRHYEFENVKKRQNEL